MADWKGRIFCAATLASILLLTLAECKKKKPNKSPKPSQNETNLFNFLRLVVYRLIYGFATLFGGQEMISDFMGGIFVPPGADDEGGDYRDYLEDDYKGNYPDDDDDDDDYY